MNNLKFIAPILYLGILLMSCSGQEQSDKNRRERIGGSESPKEKGFTKDDLKGVWSSFSTDSSYWESIYGDTISMVIDDRVGVWWRNYLIRNDSIILVYPDGTKERISKILRSWKDSLEVLIDNSNLPKGAILSPLAYKPFKLRRIHTTISIERILAEDDDAIYNYNVERWKRAYDAEVAIGKREKEVKLDSIYN